jgi:hypothetical protein
LAPSYTIGPLSTGLGKPAQATLHLLRGSPLAWATATLHLVARTLIEGLAERAMEHDRPLTLLQLGSEWLRQKKIVRPGVTRLERVVASARELAQAETFLRLAPLLSAEVREKLDAVLVPDPATGRTRLAWLQREATAITPSAIVAEIGKLTALRAIGAHGWTLDQLAPNRRRLLARIGQRATNQALQRMPPERRYPILMVFLHQAFEDTADEVVDLFDRCLATAYARARRELEEFRRSMGGRPMKRCCSSASSADSCSMLLSTTISCERTSIVRSAVMTSRQPWPTPNASFGRLTTLLRPPRAALQLPPSMLACVS